MTYKQIRKEKLRIEPYFINIAKEYYKDIDLSNKNYIWQIEQALYENKRGISEFYVNAIMYTLSLQLYPEISYDSKFVTTWI